MKTIALITTAAFVACAHHAFADEKNHQQDLLVGSVTANSADGKGKALIVIDTDGKKETREIELPEGNGARLTLTKAVPTGPQTFLGISPSALPEAVADQLPIAKGTGLLVATVLPESPAAQAGLQKNDVLVRFDDQILTNPEQLVTLVRIKKAGDEVKLSYLRKGQEATATAKLVSKEGKGGDYTPLTIDTNGNVLKLGELLDNLGRGGSPLTFEKRVMIVDPSGKVVISDAAKTIESITTELENAIKNKVGPEVMDAVKKALDQAKQAVEDGAKKAEDAAPKK